MVPKLGLHYLVYTATLLILVGKNKSGHYQPSNLWLPQAYSFTLKTQTFKAREAVLARTSCRNAAVKQDNQQTYLGIFLPFTGSL